MSALPPDRQAVVDGLKKLAKHASKLHQDKKLTWFQNEIASLFGFNNWSLLLRQIERGSPSQFFGLYEQMQRHPEVKPWLPVLLNPSIDKDLAVEEMQDWVRKKFTPLIDFAFYDSESPNGYAADDIELIYELQDEFSDKFPDWLIQEVASDMEANHGPWGQEHY